MAEKQKLWIINHTLEDQVNVIFTDNNIHAFEDDGVLKEPYILLH